MLNKRWFFLDLEKRVKRGIEGEGEQEIMMHHFVL